jgi:hypothetical protein
MPRLSLVYPCRRGNYGFVGLQGINLLFGVQFNQGETIVDGEFGGRE